MLVNTRYHFKKLLVGNITLTFLKIFLLINVFYSLIRKISTQLLIYKD